MSITFWRHMSNIPYFFDTPVPKYFRENGWLDPSSKMYFKNLAFLTWAFSRCNRHPHTIVLESKEITLQPFEFVCGREKSSIECGLTPGQFRNQQISYQKAGLLKKTTNSLTNHYSCYIWLTGQFTKDNNQQNNQPTTNQQPTNNHKLDIRNKNKETTTPTPSFQNEEEEVAFGLLLEKCKSKKFKFSEFILKNLYIENSLALCNVLTRLLDQKDISWMKTPDIWLDKNFKIEIENLKIRKSMKVKNAKTTSN